MPNWGERGHGRGHPSPRHRPRDGRHARFRKAGLDLAEDPKKPWFVPTAGVRHHCCFELSVDSGPVEQVPIVMERFGFAVKFLELDGAVRWHNAQIHAGGLEQRRI
jgi:hypothetical protein